LNYSPLPLQERAAFHEAGHVVMARELGIPVVAVTLPADLGPRHASQFAALNDLHTLVSPKEREKQFAIQRYVRFLLAGPAAILIRLERHHDIQETSVGRTGFRKRWLRQQLARNDADVDHAYSLILAWLCIGEKNHLEDRFQDLWSRAIETYELPTLWRQVELEAQRLISESHQLNVEKP
jgi:hypothetical protein